MPGGLQTESWSAVIFRQMTSFIWVAIHIPPDNAEAWWRVDEITHTGILEVMGHSAAFGNYRFQSFPLPVSWGLAVVYNVTTWDVFEPGFHSARARFTF